MTHNLQHPLVKLITAEEIFEITANRYDPEKTMLSNLRTIRVDFVDRFTPVRDIYVKMVEEVCYFDRFKCQ